MNLKFLLVIALCLTIALVFAGDRHREAAASAYPTEYSQDPGTGPIRNLRFTLFDEGVRPGELRIKSGLVQISLEDKTNIVQGLTIRRLTGAEKIGVGTVQKATDHTRGRSLFRLAPGQYELFDASQPAHKAVIMVEP